MKRLMLVLGVLLMLVEAASASASVHALAPPAVGHTSTRAHLQAYTDRVRAATSHGVPSVKAGAPFYVKDGVHGVRSGDRLGLEIYSSLKGWRLAGSWPLHRHQTYFKGYANTWVVALFRLRLVFLRNHRVLPGSSSNVFKLRVVARHAPGTNVLPQVSKDSVSSGGLGSLVARPASVVSDWNTIQCSVDVSNDGNPGLHKGVDFFPPITTLGDNVTADINQVIWERDADPGGDYGPWTIVQTTLQHLHPYDGNTIYIGNSGGDETLPDWFAFNYHTTALYHQYAWDLQIYSPSDGLWYYASPTQWYTPAAYQQYPLQIGEPAFQSPTCYTFASFR
jgi:hypothetical protein